MRVVKNILFWATTVFLVIAIMAVAVPKIFGIEFRAVLTGSMEPEIPVGSLVVVVPTAAEKIKAGDDITFVSESGSVVTHRVIEIDREKNTFTTYGIANGMDNRDPANAYENIRGVVRVHIPKVGQVFSWLSEPMGKIITVTAIIAVYLLSMLLGVLFGGKPKEKKKKKETELTLEEEFGEEEVAPPEEKETKEQSKKKTTKETTDEFWMGDGSE